LRDGLKDVSSISVKNLVIAYEPVWAIGTGRASTGENAEDVIGNHIRKTLSGLYDEEIANIIRILYGGSVTKENAREFFAQPDIDGALVGGASLKADEFIQIARAAQNT
jgi:triosephosphate isomerase (TIM)